MQTTPNRDKPRPRCHPRQEKGRGRGKGRRRVKETSEAKRVAARFELFFTDNVLQCCTGLPRLCHSH